MEWETWIRSAAKPPSDTEDSKRIRTESQIKAALSAYSPLQQKPYRVFAKGSYSNNTNVRLNYDVDIAVEYTGYFFSDLCFELEGHDKSEVGLVTSDDPYTTDAFKTDILNALYGAYGGAAVEPGRIAYRVRHNKTTLPADVVPCWEYRRYERIDTLGNPVFSTGSIVFPSTSGQKVNYPEIQTVKGTAKNNETNRRYKRMVRALKKLQTRMLADGLIEKELPSYLTESLVYNVPNNNFGHDYYLDDMRSVLAEIFNATITDSACSDWKHVHELEYLLWPGSDFKRAEVNNVAGAAWDYLGF